MMLGQRFRLVLAAFEYRCLQFEMRHPAIAGHFLRWLSVSLLFVLLIGQTTIPLDIMLAILRLTQVAGEPAETYMLSPVHTGVLMSAIVVMFATAIILAGFAQSVVEHFGERRWSLLLLGVPCACFTIFIFFVTSSSAALLGFSRGDNALLTCFLAAWGAAIGLVCAVPTSRTIIAWKDAFTSPPKRL